MPGLPWLDAAIGKGASLSERQWPGARGTSEDGNGGHRRGRPGRITEGGAGVFALLVPAARQDRWCENPFSHPPSGGILSHVYRRERAWIAPRVSAGHGKGFPGLCVREGILARAEFPWEVGARPLTASASAEPVKGGRDSHTSGQNSSTSSSKQSSRRPAYQLAELYLQSSGAETNPFRNGFSCKYRSFCSKTAAVQIAWG
jgi:hypothetical protein